MRRSYLKKSLLTACIAASARTGHCWAAEAPAAGVTADAVTTKPTCVLMEFTDNTRFAGLDTSKRLSENLMVKLLESGRFNLRETSYVGGDLEQLIADDNYPAVLAGKSAIEGGDYSAVFESPSFGDDTAQTVATARLGQTLNPAVTARVGKEQGADYLIQCTVQNIGVGQWEDVNFQTTMNIAGNLLSLAGPFGSLLGSALSNASNKTDGGFGLLTDVRVIKAATGEVVWSQRIFEKATTSKLWLVGIHSGTDNPSAKTYEKVIEKSSEKICQAMLADMDAGKLFR